MGPCSGGGRGGGGGGRHRAEGILLRLRAALPGSWQLGRSASAREGVQVQAAGAGAVEGRVRGRERASERDADGGRPRHRGEPGVAPPDPRLPRHALPANRHLMADAAVFVWLCRLDFRC